MSFGSGFREGFIHGQGHEQIERERRAVLAKPFAGNDPALTTPTRCKVLKPFFVAGQRAAVGETVVLAKHDADSLAAIGKVEITP